MIDINSFKKDKLNIFWYFVCERQSVWHRRYIEKLERPWTKDTILDKERFTNVYRELDPGTQYAIKNILEFDAPKKDKIFNIMFYRLIGRSETHAAIGFMELDSFDPKYVENKMKHIRDVDNKPVFTAAYMVGGYTKMGSKDKVENIVRLFTDVRNNFDKVYSRIESCKSSEEVYKVIRSLYGFGNFLSYQILVDLLYPLKCYENKPLLPYTNDDWSMPGPGAVRGINILLNARANILEALKWLRGNQDSEFKRLNLNFPYLLDDKGNKVGISLSNIQNCLCEFHKYIKIGDGTGRGRRKFVPAINLKYKLSNFF